MELGVGEGRGEGVGTTDRFTRLSGGKAYQGSFEPAKGEASPLGTPGRRGERSAISSGWSTFGGERKSAWQRRSGGG